MNILVVGATSGTGVLIQRTGGGWSEDSFGEDDPFTVEPLAARRLGVERSVRARPHSTSGGPASDPGGSGSAGPPSRPAWQVRAGWTCVRGREEREPCVVCSVRAVVRRISGGDQA
ncbi:hypothetical protein OIE67_18065 [Nonomuraea fuscirosea]|uniref:hypothetical protein n=1 Tax=Nonomuraea fuscirosea TaxID=1291556 RepID=UPI002DDC2BBE|nr:hypothetical protein [Nonomuraea fuscirosea]WSA56442.1 hypothetical protein OIE67_18065 [Nonomuraea fuscirosea]